MSGCIVPGKECAILEDSLRWWLADGVKPGEFEQFLDDLCDFLNTCWCTPCDKAEVMKALKRLRP